MQSSEPTSSLGSYNSSFSDELANEKKPSQEVSSGVSVYSSISEEIQAIRVIFVGHDQLISRLDTLRERFKEPQSQVELRECEWKLVELEAEFYRVRSDQARCATSPPRNPAASVVMAMLARLHRIWRRHGLQTLMHSREWVVMRYYRSVHLRFQAAIDDNEPTEQPRILRRHFMGLVALLEKGIADPCSVPQPAQRVRVPAPHGDSRKDRTCCTDLTFSLDDS